jgi:hypothetical protein
MRRMGAVGVCVCVCVCVRMCVCAFVHIHARRVCLHPYVVSGNLLRHEYLWDHKD